MRVQEFYAGQGQTIALYVSEDTGQMISIDQLWAFVAQDAQRRAAEGWKIVSVGSLPLRQMGTAGNIFLQSGGQFATMASIVIVYAAL
jgi:hypothetical protein